MSKEITNNLKNKLERQPYERIFTVTESYAGKKNLSDILAELLYSTYCKTEPENTDNDLNPSGYLSLPKSGQTHYGDSAY